MMTTKEYKYNHILFINPFGIGDVLFTTPVVRAIRENFPEAFIGYVCNRRVKEILENNPHINVLYVYEKDEYRAECAKSKFKCLMKFVTFLKSVRKDKYDLVIDLSLGRPYIFFSWLIGIKKRVGFNYKNRGLFLTDKIDIAGYENKHVVDYYLDLLKFLKIDYKDNHLQVFSLQHELDWADEFLHELVESNQGPIIGLIPAGGASWGKDAYIKHWNEDNFVKLGRMLVDGLKARLLIFGDTNEVKICDRVVKNIGDGAVNISGETNLKQFVALLKKCTLVVTNDGGPLHVAVASGVKTVSIFGPVDERVYGPYPRDGNHIIVKKDISCQPCYHRFKMSSCDNRRCLGEIEPEQVYAAVKELL